MKNGLLPETEKDETFIDKFFALPWRKFLIIASLLVIGYVVSVMVSCSSVRVVGNGGDSRVTVNQSALDSAQVVVEFKSPIKR